MFTDRDYKTELQLFGLTTSSGNFLSSINDKNQLLSFICRDEYVPPLKITNANLESLNVLTIYNIVILRGGM